MRTTTRLLAHVSPLVVAVSVGIGAARSAVPASSHRTPPSASTTVVTGHVTDAASGAGIQGAQVTVLSTTPRAGTITDSAGRYTITIARTTRGGTVRLAARRIGYAAAEHSARVRGDTVRIDLALSASVTTLAQTVVRDAAKLGDARAEAVRTVWPAASSAPAPFRAVSPATPVPFAMSRAAERRANRPRGGAPAREADLDREQYARIHDNPFRAARDHALSTFSIDVDRASYGNVRRFLTEGVLPPADAVRIEELVNYFPYALDAPRGRDPLAITTEVAAAPWQPRHRLVRIALAARDLDTRRLPPNNLVFLIDVSGSMQSPDKLPLVKESLRLLVQQMREEDRIALVVYAGSAGLVLESTPGDRQAEIMAAIDRLEAGGSTAGGAGLALAYRTVREHFLPRGNNRVILATDGDFNVGPSSDAAMERLVEAERAGGTYLTVLGFGTGNLQDAKMEAMAKAGNGNYAYIDGLAEARKVLVHEMGATLVTVANDVKLQVEFNPAAVRAYRLIGYENRLLLDEDFDDDRKDAGDVGAGHTVTALYEVVPAGVEGTVRLRATGERRYDAPAPRATTTDRDELLFVKLRYKVPGDSTSVLLTRPVRTDDVTRRPSDDFRFAAAVASFGMLLRDSEHAGSATPRTVLDLARGALGEDDGGYRAEFTRLVERWMAIGERARVSARR
jgi:Ca-activated chloride channel family protein